MVCSMVCSIYQKDVLEHVRHKKAVERTQGTKKSCNFASVKNIGIMWELYVMMALSLVGGAVLLWWILECIGKQDELFGYFVFVACAILWLIVLIRVERCVDYCDFRDEHYKDYRALELRILETCDDPRHSHNAENNSPDYDYEH